MNRPTVDKAELEHIYRTMKVDVASAYFGVSRQGLYDMIDEAGINRKKKKARARG
jgi:hypothetical protein